MHCRHCGQDVNEKAEYCIHCGCKPLSGLKFCQECGVETNENQEVCIKCGVKLLKRKSVNNSGNSGAGDKVNNFINGDKSEEENLDFRYLSPYYQGEFTKIYESNESYNGRWNWAAFFFTWMWALASLVVVFFTGGILAIPLWFYFAIRGNKIYYNLTVKKQQTVV